MGGVVEFSLFSLKIGWLWFVSLFWRAYLLASSADLIRASGWSRMMLQILGKVFTLLMNFDEISPSLLSSSRASDEWTALVPWRASVSWWYCRSGCFCWSICLCLDLNALRFAWLWTVKFRTISNFLLRVSNPRRTGYRAYQFRLQALPNQDRRYPPF